MTSERGSQKSRFSLTTSMPVFLYLAWIAIAESLTVFSQHELGLSLHAGLFATLLVHGVRERSRPLARVWLCLTFVPLIRIISLITPLAEYPLIHWYLLTGVPLFITSLALFRYIRIPRKDLSLIALWTPGQIAVGLSGLALGYIEYLILRPVPMAPADDGLAILEALVILLIFTGLLEELIFRGLMQYAATHVLGNAGVVYVALVFAVLHLGYRSLVDLVFVFAVALYFGFYVHRTKSILGVTLAHGLTNVALFLIFPYLLATPHPPEEPRESGLLSPQLPQATAQPSPTPFQPMDPTPSGSQHSTEGSLIIPDSRSPTPMALDDGDEGFVDTNLQWRLEPGGIGGVFYSTIVIPGDTSAFAEWRPQFWYCEGNILQACTPKLNSPTLAARYLVDQSAHQAELVELGEYEFSPGDNSFLWLTNSSEVSFPDELTVGFDAVRWIHKGTCSEDQEIGACTLTPSLA